ncbi:glycosyltransferase family 39 protein [Pannus brasiliensis CCIBt3594]|uniref:Glycosyltransferase family 39 protein n=1 Tax=Pannus brasiliensis CCIBt3594 TaxID=1427578 RepID=A0AAW9QRV6_9CHRO
MKATFDRVFEEWFHRIGKRSRAILFLSIAWLALVAGVAFFWRSGGIGLIDETEPLFAEASRQMFVTGDWITPYFNGVTRFDKPALTYWSQAIAFHLLGVNEWAVRLPSAIAATLVIALTFYTVHWSLTEEDRLDNVSRPARNWLVAAIASATIALSPMVIVWARTGVSDMLLTGAIAPSLLCFFLAYARPEKSPAKVRFYIAAYIFIALAILAKGPVGIVLPGLVILAFLLYVGEFQPVLREARPILGAFIIAGLSLPWYVLVIWRNGWNYINSFFGYHNVERFTEVVNGHAAPWFFYFLVVFLGFAPYSGYLPAAIARLKFWKRRDWRSLSRSRQFGLFAFFWFTVVFVFFSIAVTKLPSYVLPLMPASGILVALSWGEIFSGGKNSRSFRVSAWINLSFLTIVSIALFYVPNLLGEDTAAPDFPRLLQQSGLPTLGGIIWLFAAVAIAFFLARRDWLPVIGINLLAFMAFLLFVLTPTLFLMDSQRQLPLRQMAGSIVENQKPGEEIVMVGFKKPTVVFYSHRPVTYIKLNKEAAEYIQKQRQQRSPAGSLLILTQPFRLTRMGLQPPEYRSLVRRGAYELIRLPLGKS